MRIWLAVAAGALLLVPGGGAAQTVGRAQPPPSFESVHAHPAECARRARQIDHFERMAERARDLEHELWLERMEAHVDLLKAMQAARCPDDVPVDTTAQAFLQLLKLAGKAALTYFTFGAAGL